MNFIFRPLYGLYRLSAWVRRWTLRRFTRAGLAILTAFFVAAILGVDTENSVTYQAFPLLFAMLIVAASFCPSFRARFAVERFLPRLGTAGQAVTYRVAVRNLTPDAQHDLTLIENLAEFYSPFPEWRAYQLEEEKRFRPFHLGQRRKVNLLKRGVVKEANVPPVPPDQQVEAVVEFIPLRRGVLRFAGVTLGRADPLGLFRALINVSAPQTLLVLPKRYLVPPIALPGTVKYQPGGVALAARVGQSEEFVSLRDYRRGDPMRHIHWRSWARAGRPIVKEFEDEFFVRHALVLDTFTGRRHSDQFEEAVSVAASFVCTALTQESLLDLLFVGPQAFCFTAGRGLAHTDQMLEVLASVQACDSQPFEALERLVLTHASQVSGCICVLLAWDERRRNFIEKLRILGLPVRVLVITPAGGNLSLEAGPMQDQPERLVALEVGRIEEQLSSLK